MSDKITLAERNRRVLINVVGEIESKHGPEEALFFACQSSLNGELLRLLDTGLNVEMTDERGGTPLMTVACRGNRRGVEILLKRGANPNAEDPEGRTPLMWLMHMLPRKSAVIAIAKALLKSGADPAKRSHDGKTAYDYYVEFKRTWGEEVIRLLQPPEAQSQEDQE